jgi:MOSC domain-containing protein YiiM
VSARIRHLFLSPGHNYFGHHGRPPGTHPILEVARVRCLAGRGIEGDRFFDHKADYKGQLTLFAAETFDALRRELPAPGARPDALRRNVVVEGLDLPGLIGRTFELQGLQLVGTEECRPCYWMDTAIGPGAEAWLKGRGGLRCRILTDGELSVG